MSVLDRFYAGEVRALSSLISFVENREEGYRQLLGRLYARAGTSLRIGITGPPGAGKSTLVDCLTAEYIKGGNSVGIIAVDPTSPFTGGALLGDRVRMGEYSEENSVYFRSMATRGASGGLAGATDNVALCYDAFGFDITIIETVGVGQVELDVIDNSDVVVVVLVPESGDAVQTQKAGLMEVADLFCVNKADRSGADRLISDLAQSIELKHQTKGDWTPPVLATEAINRVGTHELFDMIAKFVAVERNSGQFEEKRRQRLSKKIVSILRYRFEREFIGHQASEEELGGLVDEIIAGGKNPFEVADILYRSFETK